MKAIFYFALTAIVLAAFGYVVYLLGSKFVLNFFNYF